MNEHRISLDLSKEPLVAPVLYLGQGDKLGTTLIVSIYDDGQVPTFESGSTVTLCMKNPGESGGYYEVAGTLEDNEATFLIDEEYAASTSGVSDIAYVEVSTSFNTTSTSRFTYVVFPSAEHGADPSSTYSNGINEAIERAIDAAEAAEGVVLQDVPLMSATVRGGAQLGDGLEITDGVLSVDPETIDLPVATTSDAGVVIADGSTITVDSDGTIHGSSSYTLPTMSANVKGGAKLGNGLSIDSNGVLSVSGSVTGVKGNSESTYRTGNVNITPANIGAATESKQEQLETAIESIAKSAWGDEDVVLDVGSKLVVTVSGTTVTVSDGAIMADGAFVQYDNSAQLTISAGSSGMNRNDLVIAKQTSSGWTRAILQGTPTSGTAVDPTPSTGEFPLWRIPITGVNVGTPARIMPRVGTLQSQITSLRDSLSHIYVSSDGRTVQFNGTDMAFRFGVASSNDYAYINVRIGDTWLGQKIIANWS